MKKTMFLATALAAALCVAPLAACGGNNKPAEITVDGKEFKLADYAQEFSESGIQPISALESASQYGEQIDLIPTLSKATDLKAKLEKCNNYFGRLYGTGENANKFQVYIFQTEKKYDSINGVSWFSSYNNSYGNDMWRLTGDASGKSKDVYFAPTGDPLPSSDYNTHPTLSAINTYYKRDKNNNTIETTTFYSYSWIDDEGGNSTFYYQLVTNTVTGAVKWESANISDTEKSPYLTDSTTYSDYSVGDTLEIKRVEIDSGASYTVSGESGRVYTYYTGSSDPKVFTLPASTISSAMLGRKLYYFEAGADAQGNIAKSESGLYVYDFSASKPKAKEIKLGLCVMDIEPIYNYTTETYDKAIIKASDYNRFGNPSSVSGPEYVLVMDDEGKISADITACGFDSTEGIYKLGESNYITQNNNSRWMILDDKGVQTAVLSTYTLSYPTVYNWEEQNALVLTTYTSDGRSIIVTDYSGKVILPMIEDARSAFISGKSIIAGNENGAAVYTIGSATPKTLEETLGISKDKLSYSFHGTQSVIATYPAKATQIGETTKYTASVDICTLEGTKITTFAGVLLTSDSVPTISAFDAFGKTYLTVTTATADSSASSGYTTATTTYCIG